MVKRICIIFAVCTLGLCWGARVPLSAANTDLALETAHEANTERPLLIRQDDLADDYIYTQAKRTLFDSPEYRFENYYWKTPLGDSIWMDLKYAGEIIQAFSEHPTWRGVEDSQIIFSLSWFFNTIKRQVANLEPKPAKAIIEELTEDGVHRETYRLGPFTLDWKMRLATGHEKVSVAYFVQLREEIDSILMARKLKETTYSLIDRKLVDEERRKSIKTALDESFAREDLFTFGPTGKSARSLKARLASVDWQIVATILTILGVIIGFYFGFRHFFKS